MTENIYILLPVHNRREITRRFVECLKTQTYIHYHLVLIDDGSTDGTEEMVREEIGLCTVIKGVGNWWWAGSLQQGYVWLKQHNAAAHDIVLIANDDTEFDRNFLETGRMLLKQHEKTLLLAHCYNRRNNQLMSTGIHVDWRKLTFNQTSTPEEINCLPTRGLFLRTADFFEIGCFHPRLLPHYLSDYEFTIRAHRKGMKLISSPALRAWVDVDATGYRSFERNTVSEYLVKFFSKKSADNPLYWSIFIALACPWPWKLIGWLRVWKHTLVSATKALLFSIKNAVNI